MDNIQSTYKDMDDDDGGGGDHWFDALDQIPNPSSSPSPLPLPLPLSEQQHEIGDHHHQQLQDHEMEDEPVKSNGVHLPIDDIDIDNEDDDNANATAKKQKPLSSFATTPNPTKKPKKKTNNNVWTYKSTSRKGKKKPKPSPSASAAAAAAASPVDKVMITPVPRVPDRSDDSPAAAISLSKVHKAERVELSEDRLAAASNKGYRMVRATRGVKEGHWYFEIRVTKLGPTGHVRLGWCTEKGDLQAPVGYDASSYGYRDLDGSKVHKAVRTPYGDEGYGEGDVIGFYIALPEGEKYVPKLPHLVWYKGQRCYTTAGKGEAPKVVPGSEISFFKNGLCQGTAFKDLFGGRYYPAASMYTMPNEPNCEVRFNFGPDFDFFPQDFGGRQTPRPMVEVPYYEYDLKVGGHAENGLQ